MNIVIDGYIEVEEELLTDKKAVMDMIARDVLERLKDYMKIQVIDSPSSLAKRVLYAIQISIDEKENF